MFPGATQACDGVDNDCDDPDWPAAPPDEADADGYRPCGGDCDDANPAVHPAALEVCNAIDDDCDLLIDEDALVQGSDADTVANLCDNCPVVANPSQADADLDGFGDDCDNCPFEPNPGQVDSDEDREGDWCDLGDGMIYVWFPQSGRVAWQIEGFAGWNVYRGDLAVLADTGEYTQAPGCNPLALRACGLIDPWLDDGDALDAGQVAFYLTTGVATTESDLGRDSFDALRPNANRCP